MPLIHARQVPDVGNVRIIEIYHLYKLSHTKTRTHRCHIVYCTCGDQCVSDSVDCRTNHTRNVVDRFFMKLFNTSDIETVNICQSYFACDLPSVQILKRAKILKRTKKIRIQILGHCFDNTVK